MAEIFGADAYSPKQIAERVRSVGVTKARLPLLSLIALGVLAGGFIGLGANFYNVVTSDPSLGYATARLLGGLVFSLGLILVVVAGATLVVLSGQWQGNSGSDGNRALVIAEAKVSLPFMEAFFRGVLCNILVCLAVWLAMAARHVSGKILAIIFPISAFVAAGFEHCVANMYFIPLGLLLDAWTPLQTSGTLSWQGLIHNLVPVTLGNLVGGAGMVGLVYYVIYVRGERA